MDADHSPNLALAACYHLQDMSKMFFTEQLEEGGKINKRKGKEDGGKGAKRRIMSLVLQVCCVEFIFPQTLRSLLSWSTFLVDSIK